MKMLNFFMKIFCKTHMVRSRSELVRIRKYPNPAPHMFTKKVIVVWKIRKYSFCYYCISKS